MSIKLSPQQLKTLSSAFIFKNMDEIMIEQLVADPRCTLEVYPRGGVIFDETHFCRSLGIVLSGECCCNKKETRPATYTLESDAVLTEAQLADFCRYLAKFALRIKGFLRGENGWIHADCVGKQINVAPAADDMEIMLETGKLVIIGSSPDEFEDDIMFAWERYCPGHYDLICTK